MSKFVTVREEALKNLPVTMTQEELAAVIDTDDKLSESQTNTVEALIALDKLKAKNLDNMSDKDLADFKKARKAYIELLQKFVKSLEKALTPKPEHILTEEEIEFFRPIAVNRSNVDEVTLRVMLTVSEAARLVGNVDKLESFKVDAVSLSGDTWELTTNQAEKTTFDGSCKNAMLKKMKDLFLNFVAGMKKSGEITLTESTE